MKKLIVCILLVYLSFCLSACGNKDDDWLQRQSSRYECAYNVVVFNADTNQHILTIQGRSYVIRRDEVVVITVKIGPKDYLRHYIRLTDNTGVIVQDITNTYKQNDYTYKIYFGEI